MSTDKTPPPQENQTAEVVFQVRDEDNKLVSEVNCGQDVNKAARLAKAMQVVSDFTPEELSKLVHHIYLDTPVNQLDETTKKALEKLKLAFNA